MKLIDLDQGSSEWLEFRGRHIGASDCGSIMGLNPFKSERDVFEEKVFNLQPNVTKKMLDGQKNEEEARNQYIIEKGIFVKPAVAECEIFPFISGSFDGINLDNQLIVELKTGASSHRLAKLGVIPPYYEAQLNHLLYLTDLESMDYFSFHKGESILIRFYRNDDFIKNMIAKYLNFWDMVENKIYIEL